ncbi:N-acetyllactosaminide beta-1,6-N-acetylglucosaminyl-transferase-like isoform X2 [Pomacea canaliculata]|nr:N-acetyllactosaminide beta-1,6-N-acetylglucosaminyl-transferase-like isoform X2 [Pomacea canaliculata]
MEKLDRAGYLPCRLHSPPASLVRPRATGAEQDWGEHSQLQTSYPQLGGEIVSKKPSVTVKDPIRFVSADDVGLRGLQNYDCVRAIEGFPLSSKDFGENSVPRIWDEDFIRLTSNCENFRKRFGYERYGQVSKEELDFPLAFNVLLYKDVDQLHMLLRAIYRPHNVYCLHVDGYANASVYKATAALANCLDNVFLTSKRENITYSGFTRLQADINCMQDHMTWKAEKQGVKTNSKIPWRYLINLPSQQFPLKTNAELVKILTIYNGSNDVEGITAFQVLEERFTLKHVYKWDPKTQRKMIVRTKERLEPPPYNATVVKGSAYGVFSRDFVHFVLHDEHAKALLNWTRHVYSPDEFYWSILHHNPSLGTPGAYHGRPDKKPWLAVYASWPPRDLCVSGKVVRGICIFGVGRPAPDHGAQGALRQQVLHGLPANHTALSRPVAVQQDYLLPSVKHFLL